MVNIDEFYHVVEEQLEIVLAIDSPEVTEAAKKIAYYVAMIDAATEDPLEDADEQDAILARFKTTLQNLTETYQQLVNERM